MKCSVRSSCIGAAAIFAAAVLNPPNPAAAQSAGDGYVFSIAPYLWLPSINGTLKYGVPPGTSGRPEVNVGTGDYVASLNFAFMVNGEVRKGPWSLYTDFIYLDVGSETSAVQAVDFGGSVVSSSLNANTKTSLTGEVWTLAGGYEVVRDKSFKLNSFAGFRYFGLQTETNWKLSAAVAAPGGGQAFGQSGRVSKTVDLWDGIYGIRGRVRLDEGGWSIPFYADVGTGSSDLTWQAMLGLGYQLSWVEIILAYRHLSYSQDENELVKDLSFSGPQFGALFRF